MSFGVHSCPPPTSPAWGDMPPVLRSGWCHAMLTYYPIMLVPTIMGLIAQATNRVGWHNASDWIALATEFDAAGFLPHEYIVLNQAVRRDERAKPTYPDYLGKPYVSNSRISLVSGRGGQLTIRLRATEWSDWLERVRAGEDPVLVATELLAPHWGEPAEVIHT